MEKGRELRKENISQANRITRRSRASGKFREKKKREMDKNVCFSLFPLVQVRWKRKFGEKKQDGVLLLIVPCGWGKVRGRIL